MSKTLDRTEASCSFHSGFGFRHSFVIGCFVIRHSSMGFKFKVALSKDNDNDSESSERMHILILCEYGTINGGERSLIAALDRCPPDVRITVLAPAEGRIAAALANRTVSHVPFSLQDSTGSRRPPDEIIDTLAVETERLAPDVVHANSLSMGRITGRLSGRIAVPCTAHLRDIVRLSGTAVRHLNSNQKLIAVSQATRDFHTAQGLDSERVVVLYNGVDCEQWRPRPGTGFLRDQWQLSEDSVIAVTVGQIGMRKGLDLLVEAAIQTADDIPDLHYAMIGERFSTKSESIAYEQSLHDRLKEAGFADRFHWFGYRDDVSRLLSEADFFIHSARQEPFGRVLLEAAASGLPIIATRVGGTTEMLTDQDSALIVDPEDASALGHAMRRLASEEALRTQLGAAARNSMSSRFDIADRARDLFALWRDVAG